MSDNFDAEWLQLREPFDGRARSVPLALLLADALPVRPRIIDLGAGTGSLFRWLAPYVGRTQIWTLVDSNAALLDRAFDDIAEAADRVGWTVTLPKPQIMLVHTPVGVWRVEAQLADLAEAPGNLKLDQADGVVSSALCDLVSHAWVARMAAALQVPFYAALNVDGHEGFFPPHPKDGLVARGFRRDQTRDKGFGGRALGPAAPAVLAQAFRAHGFSVTTAPSPWRIPAATPAMAEALADGHADAALRALPRALAPTVEEWRKARQLQAARGALMARVGHADLLALPPATPKPTRVIN
ncbi:class I SAM-dependent methyltransferase [Pseudoroseomonas wenyumeiae]|uniref:Class I SAM-dependent methyltransferase n=1 Tax=Teichococcus wenyumeiae TaxID=2478470 RepID=A0A3A9JK52_9PROT|nr:class I SAM-dependent methyltransferase [Pseudoroseomonas wenyumeiae]RKK05163.1 class I SAM-dependent methyltransferase [Pseudoroseomonas wenyumeiae]RMI20053.1 class I SAM-dependent methyltransferase [Pseudoroseomonas wenyumeiae]